MASETKSEGNKRGIHSQGERTFCSKLTDTVPKRGGWQREALRLKSAYTMIKTVTTQEAPAGLKTVRMKL